MAVSLCYCALYNSKSNEVGISHWGQPCYEPTKKKNLERSADAVHRRTQHTHNAICSKSVALHGEVKIAKQQYAFGGRVGGEKGDVHLY